MGNLDSKLNNVQFNFDDLSPCRIVFVFDAVPPAAPRFDHDAFRVFIASEPPSVKSYNTEFLSQFDIVLTTDPNTAHARAKLTQLGLPWLVGAWDSDGNLLKKPLNYADFTSLRPVKTKQVSVISSNKAYTQGHRDRLAFVQGIKKYFGEEIDVFGRGINGFSDKLDVLSDYRYHIAIENSAYTHYWTEKISDPFLTLTYPIYYGCDNIFEYFPEQSLSKIDIHNLDESIQIIKRTIESDTAERELPYLEEARRRVLNEHNLFFILSEIAGDVVSNRDNITQRRVRGPLKPEEAFKSKDNKLRRSLNKRIEKLQNFFR